MADSFSELNLFAEFERTPEPADKILMSKCNADLKRDFTEHVSASDELLGLRVDEGEHGIEDSSVGSRLGVGTEIADGENPPTESEKRRQVTHRQSLRESSDKKSAADIAKLKAELCKLREDCEKLKRHSRLISTSKFGKLEEGPVIQVLYMNNHLSSKCRDMLETVLCRFIHENSHKNFINNQEKGIAPSSLCLDKDNDEVPIPEEKIRQIRTSTVIGCSQMYRQFIIDTMGWPLINNNPEASESWDRPNYKQVFKISLGDEVGEKENSCPQKLRRFSCFNCDGDHNMKDCKEPYNSAKVAQNKQKFRSETQSLQKQNSRYHVNDPKFSKFKAGCISEELRKAMGLADDQLPIYIYNMRRLGYPPGHFQALTDDSSGIAMFGNDGREISLSGEPVEEGEVEAAIPTSYCVDVTKIIEYPGYNVPLEGGVKDESKLLGKLEFSSRQSKEKMAEKVSEKNRGVKRRSNGDSMPKMKRKRGEEKPINMDISNMASLPFSSERLEFTKIFLPSPGTPEEFVECKPREYCAERYVDCVPLASCQAISQELLEHDMNSYPCATSIHDVFTLPAKSWSNSTGWLSDGIVLPSFNEVSRPLLPPGEIIPPPLPPEEAINPPLPPEEVTLPPLPHEETTFPPLPPEEVTLPPLPPEEIALPPLPLEETTSPPLLSEDATLPLLPLEDTTPPPMPPEIMPPPASPVPATLSLQLSYFGTSSASIEANLAPFSLKETTPVLLPPKETTLLLLPPEKAMPPPLPFEEDILAPENVVLPSLSPVKTTEAAREDILPPLPPEEATLPPLPPEEATPPPVASEEEATLSSQERKNSIWMKTLSEHESSTTTAAAISLRQHCHIENWNKLFPDSYNIQYSDVNNAKVTDTPDSPEINETTVCTQPKLVPLEKENWMESDTVHTMSEMRGPENVEQLYTATTPDSPTDGDTLTLEELQQQKALIKQQLALAEGSDADIEVLDSYEEESIAPTLLPTPIQLPQQKDTPPATPQTSTSRHEHPNTTPLFKTPESSHHLRTPSTGGSLSLSLGTPVIDSGQSVPEAEKFSKGIQQEIPFENLPGATGTFERVKRVLSRLRSQKDNSS